VSCDSGAGSDTARGEGGDDVLMCREGNDTFCGDATYPRMELQGAELFDGGGANIFYRPLVAEGVGGG
jgi:Ca2+-binding RTX toxin-like protein